jgi:hypothetical protein
VARVWCSVAVVRGAAEGVFCFFKKEKTPDVLPSVRQPFLFNDRKNLAAHISIKKGQFLTILRHFFRPIPSTRDRTQKSGSTDQKLPTFLI